MTDENQHPGRYLAELAAKEGKFTAREIAANCGLGTRETEEILAGQRHIDQHAAAKLGRYVADKGGAKFLLEMQERHSHPHRFTEERRPSTRTKSRKWSDSY